MARSSKTATRVEGEKTPVVRDWASLCPKVTPALLDDIARRIVERFHPERIILFGSHAYGTPHLYSDVDLLVVMNSEESRARRASQVRMVADTPYLPMDIIVYTPEELATRAAMGDPLVADVLTKGVVLYDNGGRMGGHQARTAGIAGVLRG